MRWIGSGLLVVLAVIPFVYIVTPLVHLVLAVTPGELWNIVHDANFLGAIATSASSALFAVGLTLLFGIPTAFLLSVANFPFKRVLEGVFVIPLVLPPIVGGIAQLNVYGPETTTGAWFASHGIFLTDSLFGVVLAQSFVTSPFLILAAKNGFDQIPTELQDATRLLGGGLVSYLVYVAIPIAKQAIAVGAVLTFTRAIGEFGATVMMAYHPYTVPTYLWVQFSSVGVSGIIPIAAILMVLVVILCLVSVTTQQVLAWRLTNYKTSR